MNIKNPFSLFFKKNNEEINKIYKLKFEAAKNLIVKDRERYLNEYNDDDSKKYINNHFDKLQEQLIIIDLKKDLNKMQFFTMNFLDKDFELFTYLSKAKENKV